MTAIVLPTDALQHNTGAGDGKNRYRDGVRLIGGRRLASSLQLACREWLAEWFVPFNP